MPYSHTVFTHRIHTPYSHAVHTRQPVQRAVQEEFEQIEQIREETERCIHTPYTHAVRTHRPAVSTTHSPG